MTPWPDLQALYLTLMMVLRYTEIAHMVEMEEVVVEYDEQIALRCRLMENLEGQSAESAPSPTTRQPDSPPAEITRPRCHRRGITWEAFAGNEESSMILALAEAGDAVGWRMGGRCARSVIRFEDNLVPVSQKAVRGAFRKRSEGQGRSTAEVAAEVTAHWETTETRSDSWVLRKGLAVELAMCGINGSSSLAIGLAVSGWHAPQA